MGIAVKAEQATGRKLHRISKYLVYFGGVVLTGIAIMTVISVIGRAFVKYGLGPIPGDFELVEAGSAVAVFAFLPWCQLNRGHVSVDIVTNNFPDRLQALLVLIGDLAITAVAVVIAWRMWMGMGERVSWFSQPVRDAIGFGYKPFSVETTFILAMPVWYGFALAMIGASLFVVVALYTVWRSLNGFLDGRVHA
jgi:TRAP-type C4-dicarboxylate transport system permease small subunit